MLNDSKKQEIEKIARSIDRFSEKYQLSHATVAIERMYKDEMQAMFAEEYASLRQQIQEATDSDAQTVLAQKVQELKKESNRRINISVEYTDKMEENCSRTMRTQNDTFLISLPKCLTVFRDDDDKLDYCRLSRLRKLMAHELGHIVLHCDLFKNHSFSCEKDREDEANCFAECLLKLREKTSVEMANALGCSI